MRPRTSTRIRFLTPGRYLREQRQGAESPRGQLVVVSCRSGAHLAREVVGDYERLLREGGATRPVTHLEGIDFKF